MIRIMIVDDEAPIRDLLASALAAQKDRYTVVGVASDGQEALTRTRELQPDVVITDIYMPGMTGLEFLRQAAKEECMPRAVIISGYDEFDYARQAMALGVTDYLLKPFLPEELFEVLDRIGEDLEKQRVLHQNLEDLRTRADEQRLLLQEQVCRRVLRGELESAPAPETQESQAFDFGARHYLATQILMETLAEEQSMHARWASLLQQYFPPHLRLYSVSLNPSRTALIFSSREGTGESFIFEVSEGLRRSQHSLTQHYDLKTRCAMGGCRGDWRALPESWEEAKAAWRMQPPSETLTRYTPAPAEGAEMDAGKQIRRMKSSILLDISLGKKQEARQGIETLMKRYATVSGRKSDYIFISVGELVYAAADELETKYGPLPAALRDQEEQLRRELEYSGLLDLKERLIAYSDACCDYVAKQNQNKGTTQMKEMVIALVEQEMANPDLDLEMVAGRLNFSTNYVRQSFRQQQGEAFSDYVIRRRMEKAGTMLRTTSVLVQEVAEACGYANQRYFASSFKKYYGMTPTEYMRERGNYHDSAD